MNIQAFWQTSYADEKRNKILLDLIHQAKENCGLDKPFVVGHNFEEQEAVVRCKDCKYGKPLLDETTLDENTIKYAHLIECNITHDWCTDNIECHDENWFCADGKRKECR